MKKQIVHKLTWKDAKQTKLRIVCNPFLDHSEIPFHGDSQRAVLKSRRWYAVNCFACNNFNTQIDAQCNSSI